MVRVQRQLGRWSAADERRSPWRGVRSRSLTLADEARSACCTRLRQASQAQGKTQSPLQSPTLSCSGCVLAGSSLFLHVEVATDFDGTVTTATVQPFVGGSFFGNLIRQTNRQP